MSSPPTYHRASVRSGKLPLDVRIYQGIGGCPDTWKNFAFNTFLLLYYSQILGLEPVRASLALMIALVLDAISDPLVGSLSDGFRSRLGRRHPFMYGAVLPLGACLVALFSPPSGLDQLGMFLWLTFFTVAVRTAMTFFLVPWNALFAEFSDDYAERTAVVTYRYIVGWTGGLLFTLLTWRWVFPSTPDYTPGHFNPAAYSHFAWFLGISVAVAAFLTTHLTRAQIPYLLQPDVSERFALMRVLREVGLALRNRSFLAVFLAILVGGAIGGTTGALGIYLQSYFWGLTPENLSWFAVAAIGAVIAFIAIGPLQKRFDKKTLLLVCLTGNLVDGLTLVSLRLLDVLPSNGSSLLLVILVAGATISAWLGTTAGIIGASMIADTLDEQEYETGRRQEGVFSAALSFSGKVTSGVGVLLSGLLLQYAIGLPTGTKPADTAPETIQRIGLVVGLCIPLLNIVPIWIISHYRLTRENYATLRAQLEVRRAAASG